MKQSPPRDTVRKPRGRLRASWAVLRGELTTPPQIRAEWIEYQIAFDGILDKLNTALARIAKREQRDAARMMEAIGNGTQSEAEKEPPGGHKAEIRRKVAALQAQAYRG